MKITLTTMEAAQRLHKESGKFSFAGALALVKHLESIEEDSGVEMEFDVVAICQDYSEFPSAVEAANDFGIAHNGTEEDAMDALAENKFVIPVDGGRVIV